MPDAPITLVCLAAGSGSRFGGPKQLEPLGPGGETMLDFAIHDARRAGFDAVVLIIRREMQDAFERGVVARWGDVLPISFAYQDIPAGRKPWGTVDAVLAAASRIDGAFAVVNADDYYGAQAYHELGAFLRAAKPSGTDYAVVGFPLGETLSESGGVTRALLETSPDGWLEHIEEMFDVVPRDDGAAARAANGTVHEIPLTTLVSMNMWGFTPAAFPQMSRGFETFRNANEPDPRAELPLPTLVESLVRDREARVRLLRGEGPWCGMTYPADRERVASVLGGIVAQGDYRPPG
jgi:hypothetical protein